MKQSPAATDRKTPEANAELAASVARARLRVDVAKQSVRLAKEELKRARKRFKDAKREVRRARKRASAARRAWKQARRTRPTRTGTPKAVVKTTVKTARKKTARAGTKAAPKRTKTKAVRRVVKAVVKAVAKRVARKSAIKRPTVKKHATARRVVAVAPRRPPPRSRKAPPRVPVQQAPAVTPVIEGVEADVTALPTATSS